MLRYNLMLLAPKIVLQAQVLTSTWIHGYNDYVDSGPAISGSYDDVRMEMTILFGSQPGLDDYGRSYIRELPEYLPTRGQWRIYFGRSAASIFDGEMVGVTGSYITVLDDRRIWARVPYIDPGNGEIFKDSERAYTWQNEHFIPKANAGPYVAGNIGANGYFRTTLDGSGSFDIGGRAISSYGWELPPGAVVVSGTIYDPVLTVDFPPGFWWVALTVWNDDPVRPGGHHSWVGIYAHDLNNDQNRGNGVYVRNFNIASWRITPQGQEIEFDIYDDIPTHDTSGVFVPDGTLVMLWEESGDLGYTQGFMRFVGWIDGEPTSIRGDRLATLKDTRIKCIDVAGRMRKVTGYSQQIEKRDDGQPLRWTEMKEPNLDKYIDYILRWHSTVLEVTTVHYTGIGNEFPFVILDSDVGSLFDQVNTLAKTFVPNRYLVCNRRGILYIRVDPMLIDLPLRPAFVRMALTESDWVSISYERNKQSRVRWLHASGLMAGGDRNNIIAVFNRAPGVVPGQGVEEVEVGHQLVADRHVFDVQEGNRYARLQASESIYRIELAGMIPNDLEPALYEWVTLTISPEYAAQRGLSFTSARGLIQGIDIRVKQDRFGMTHEVTLEWEREVSGPPAAYYYPPATR